VVPLLLAAGGLLAAALQASVIDDMRAKIQQSEFVFPKAEVNAPFVPLSWVCATYYSDSQTELPTGLLRFEVTMASEALFAPLWVGKKDMLLAGEYASWQRIQVEVPNPDRLTITTFVPMLGWARQFDPKTQGGVFVAPTFVHGGEYNGYSLSQTSVYAGAVAFRWDSDRFAWGGGLVGYAVDGDTTWFPYLGALWRPTQEFSMALILPWPTMTYAPSKHYMFMCGLAPAGATLGTSRDGQKLEVGFSSWNLVFSAHRRLTNVLWLSAGVGWSGLGSFTLTSEGDTELKHKLDRGPVLTLQLSLRPPLALSAQPGDGASRSL